MEKFSYMIHSFMYDSLGLSGAELLVFAIIHSFTLGEKGCFYGTQDYLSKRGGVSLSTVKRALSSLLSKGIIRKSFEDGKDRYRAVLTANNYSEPEPDAPPNDAEFEVFPEGHGYEKEPLPILDIYQKKNPRPKYEFYSFGTHECVKMTAEQYLNLLKLVSPEKLFEYCTKLGVMIDDMNYHPKSCYKTIKKWIYKDAAL